MYTVKAEISGTVTKETTVTGIAGVKGTVQANIDPASTGYLPAAKILQYPTIYDFPNRGNENTLYLAQNENSSYRWDEAASKYYCIGRDWQEISAINGGDLNE
jgi:hypothetical protein